MFAAAVSIGVSSLGGAGWGAAKAVAIGAKRTHRAIEPIRRPLTAIAAGGTLLGEAVSHIDLPLDWAQKVAVQWQADRVKAVAVEVGKALRGPASLWPEGSGKSRAAFSAEPVDAQTIDVRNPLDYVHVLNNERHIRGNENEHYQAAQRTVTHHWPAIARNAQATAENGSDAADSTSAVRDLSAAVTNRGLGLARNALAGV